MGIDQVTVGYIVGVRGVGQDRTPSLCLERQHSGLGVTRPEILCDAEKDSVSVRQHFRKTMSLLLACRIGRRHGLALSAVLWDPRQAPSPVTTHVDIAVCAP